MDFPRNDCLRINCKENVTKYITYPILENENIHYSMYKTYDCFLKLDKKTVCVRLLGKIFHLKNNPPIILVNITDFIDVHQFLTESNLFLAILLGYSSFTKLLKPINEKIYFYIFSEDNLKNICFPYNNIIDSVCKVLSEESLEKIMCILSLYNLNKSTNHYDYGYFFGILCKRGDCYLVQTFLKKWNMSVSSLNKCTYNAVISGRIEVVKLLVENGANTSLEKTDLIEATILNNYVDIFNYIFYPSIDMIYIKNETFIECMEKNNLEIMQSILSKATFTKAWINNMFCESYKSSSEVASLLVSAGANVKKYGKEVLENALQANNVDLSDYLKKLD